VSTGSMDAISQDCCPYVGFEETILRGPDQRPATYSNLVSGPDRLFGTGFPQV